MSLDQELFLGSTSRNRGFYWDPLAHPSLYVWGATARGKTSYLKYLASQAAARGYLVFSWYEDQHWGKAAARMAAIIEEAYRAEAPYPTLILLDGLSTLSSSSELDAVRELLSVQAITGAPVAVAAASQHNPPELLRKLQLDFGASVRVYQQGDVWAEGVARPPIPLREVPDNGRTHYFYHNKRSGEQAELELVGANELASFFRPSEANPLRLR